MRLETSPLLRAFRREVSFVSTKVFTYFNALGGLLLVRHAVVDLESDLRDLEEEATTRDRCYVEAREDLAVKA